MDFIYTITVIPKNWPSKDSSHPHTVGWLKDLESAKQAVLNNHNDLFEINCIHRAYAVIEKVHYGVFGSIFNDYEKCAWFQCDTITGKDGHEDCIVQEIPEPEQFECIVCFSM